MGDKDYMNIKGGKFVQLSDESGGVFELFHYEGLILPRYFPLSVEPVDLLRSLKDFCYKKGDIMISAYPKSGNHWFVNLLNHMLSPKPIEETESVNVNLMEGYPMNKLEVLQSPRVLISHLPVSHLPADHFKNCGKTIVLLRNPKDIAVSYWYHLTKDRFMGCSLSWDGFLKHFMKGNILYGFYFEYLRMWQRMIQKEKYPNIMYIYYEDLKEKTLEELQRVQQFLGLDMSKLRLNQIIAKCSLTSLKSAVESGRLRTRLVDENRQPFIYRKGEIGDWKNHFTVLQNIEFNQLIEKQMKDSMFHFRYQFKSDILPTHRL